jgi:hypothetical protein
VGWVAEVAFSGKRYLPYWLAYATIAPTNSALKRPPFVALHRSSLAGDEGGRVSLSVDSGSDHPSRSSMARASFTVAIPPPSSSMMCAAFVTMAALSGANTPRRLLELEEVERRELTSLASRRSTAQSLALRARIVLACADGEQSKIVAARLGVDADTVGKRRRRFAEHRLGCRVIIA